ncbi:hypothetical protein BpHYR1_005815 [Brachionus plicatilis]|uniref:Uncharacterized protein n=1 Tax=Brachionus plicatilis TaxID=10195 RepID=A0A3M7QEB9_BRAPC|nr:hypothetical protein BpHYR1_005815 [Brachionus plicatilis]
MDRMRADRRRLRSQLASAIRLEREILKVNNVTKQGFKEDTESRTVTHSSYRSRSDACSVELEIRCT